MLETSKTRTSSKSKPIELNQKISVESPKTQLAVLKLEEEGKAIILGLSWYKLFQLILIAGGLWIAWSQLNSINGQLTAALDQNNKTIDQITIAQGQLNASLEQIALIQKDQEFKNPTLLLNPLTYDEETGAVVLNPILYNKNSFVTPVSKIQPESTTIFTRLCRSVTSLISDIRDDYTTYGAWVDLEPNKKTDMGYIRLKTIGRTGNQIVPCAMNVSYSSPFTKKRITVQFKIDGTLTSATNTSKCYVPFSSDGLNVINPSASVQCTS